MQVLKQMRRENEDAVHVQKVIERERAAVRKQHMREAERAAVERRQRERAAAEEKLRVKAEVKRQQIGDDAQVGRVARARLVGTHSCGEWGCIGKWREPRDLGREMEMRMGGGNCGCGWGGGCG